MIPRLLGERFELGEPIGRGGMGVVYLARDRINDSPCAVKLLSDEDNADTKARARFAREMANVQRLRHPGIVRTLACGETEDVAWLAMEFVSGVSLDREVAQRGAAPPNIAAAWITQLADALSHAHDVGIAHRDVKPSNVVVNGTRDRARLVLLDFGISRVVNLLPQELTTVGVAIGTPGFMSPESRAGKRVDARADVFSLAVLAAWLLAGRLPMAAWALPPEPAMFGPLRPWPAPMDDVLAAALHPDVQQRTRSPRDFAVAFAEVVRDAVSWPALSVAHTTTHDAMAPDLPTAPWRPAATVLPEAPR